MSEAAAALRGRLAGTTGRGVAAARLPGPGVAGDASSDEASSDEDGDDELTTTDESSGEEEGPAEDEV